MNKHIGSNFDDFLEEEKMSHMSEKDIENQNEDRELYLQLMARRTKRQEELKEKIGEVNPEALLADGHDNALAGYDTKGRAIYFVNEILGILETRDGMTQEEALEFFEFNIADAYVGEYTPIYMWEE